MLKTQQQPLQKYNLMEESYGPKWTITAGMQSELQHCTIGKTNFVRHTHTQPTQKRSRGPNTLFYI